jgi:hypothetical protein
MSILKEIWTSSIQENLYANNDHVTLSTNHDPFVVNNKIHVPQAGAKPTITLNPSSFPLTATQRTDTDLNYTCDNYSVSPTLITDIESFQIQYDKRMSVMNNIIKSLNTDLGSRIFYKWGAGSTVFSTTGSASSSGLASGATGSRKKMTLADAFVMQTNFDKTYVPKDNRYLMLPTDMYYELIQDANVLPAYSLGQAVIGTGVLPKIAGFTVLQRPDVWITDGSNNLKTYGASGSSGDCLAGFAWHPDFVAKGLGSILSYVNQGSGSGDAFYQGIIISGAVFFGASQMYATHIGTAVIQSA